MDVSVIVPTLNEEDNIGVCLRSICGQKTRYEFEVIVCDGRSEDRTAAIAERFADRVVVSKRRSVGIQRTSGARIAKGRFLLFVDADTVLPPGYIESAAKKFNDRKVAGFSAGFRFSQRTRRLIFSEKVVNNYLAFRDSMGAATLPGFNTWVRKDVFWRLQGFRDVPLEDIDFSIRLNRIGVTHYYTDLYVVTSSRRLEEMGLLGTIRYYLEMELARMNPRLKRLLTYNDYVSCRVDAKALDEALTQLSERRTKRWQFSANMRKYALRKASAASKMMREELDETASWAKNARKKLAEDTVAALEAMSYLESKAIDRGVVDRAIERLRKEMKR